MENGPIELDQDIRMFDSDSFKRLSMETTSRNAVVAIIRKVFQTTAIQNFHIISLKSLITTLLF